MSPQSMANALEETRHRLPRQSQDQSVESFSHDSGQVYSSRPGSDSHPPVSQLSWNTSPPMSDNFDQPGSKRKRSVSSRVVKKDERKKVSRACDTCKSRKLRCTGTQPCSRCSSQRLICEYNALHRRGKPPSPEPSEPVQASGYEPLNSNYPSPRSPPSHHDEGSTLPAGNQASEVCISDQHRKSSRSSQEPEETRFEGHYIGPTSGIAFLHRAQRRLKQDFVATISSTINGTAPPRSSVFSFGDGYYPKYSGSNLSFPPSLQAKHLVDRYFDFAMPTYRFLRRATVEGWLSRLCDENDNKVVSGPPLSNAKVSILLLTFATATLYEEDATGSLLDSETDDCEQSEKYFTAAERRIAEETGPVRLESVQARLAQCMYLLGSSRINQAWYTFGTASQMVLALGIHRKRFSHGRSSDLIEVEMQKRVFWAAYTLDKYLSIILGRPRVFRDEDIDQHFPERLSDDDLVANTVIPKASRSQCISDGPVFHAKLAKIVGKISSDLYPTNKNSSDSDWIEIAQTITGELKAWKESLPAFLEPEKVDPTMLIPLFQRQSTVLRLAYLNALILANRPSLLHNFADLSRSHNPPSGELNSSLKECIDAASAVVETVNGFIEQSKMRKPFWFTHYISFCAISAIYVYTIQQNHPEEHLERRTGKGAAHLQLFEAAERCQKNIYATTAPSSPFRRYNIILDELKREVLLHLGKTPPSTDAHVDHREGQIQEQAQQSRTSHLTNPSSFRVTPNRMHTNNATYPMDFRAMDQLTEQDGQIIVPTFNDGSIPGDFQMFNASAQNFEDSLLDLGLFGPQGEFVGWAELDSCVIAWPDGFEYDSWQI